MRSPTRSWPSLSGVLFVVLLACLATAGPAAAPARAADGEETGRLVLLLDSSGSMKEPTSGGGSKIDAARSALGDVVDQLPDSVQVGVRVFGAKVFSRQDPGACTDTQNVVPVGPLDRSRLRSAVAGYQPYGETPIGNALKGAARDLGAARAGERRTIVLLSDGEPTCAPDPCLVARQLRQRGIDLRINVVGLDVSGKARSALQCVAKAGGGRYFDASSSAELSDSLVQVSVRALRLFSLAGDPAQGGTSTADPTALEPGDYVDETLPDEAPRFYLVDVPKGGSVSAAAVMRPARGSDKLLDAVGVTLLTPDGTRCDNDLSTGLNALMLTSIVGSAAYYNPLGTRTNEACEKATQLLVQVDFNGPATPFGLRIRAYPEVTDAQSLPEQVDFADRDSWERPVPLEGAGTPLVGGASFESAPEIEPGTTYADTLRPREQLIYKVRVGYGQSPRMTARVESDPQAARLQGTLGVQVQATAFNALGKELATTSNSANGVRPTGRYNGDDPVPLTQAQPPVRFRNVESPSSRINDSSLDGYYYFTLEMGGDSDLAAEQFAAPVRLAVAVDGEETGVPEYAGAVAGETAPTVAPSPGQVGVAADDDQQRATLTIPGWVLAVGGVVLAVGVAILAGFVLGRRRD